MLVGAELTVGPITRCFKCSNIEQERDRIKNSEQKQPLKTILKKISDNKKIVFVSDVKIPLDKEQFLTQVCSTLETDLLVITSSGYMTVLDYQQYDLYFNNPIDNPIKDLLYDKAIWCSSLSKYGTTLFIQCDCSHPEFTLSQIQFDKNNKNVKINNLMLDNDFLLYVYDKMEVDERDLYEKLKKKYN